ncbi:MAG: hypothetical protein ACE5LH_00340 [Fidelibacterota bacterium]
MTRTAVAVFFLTLLSAQSTPERVTEEILFDVGKINRMDVTISYSLGSLTLTPNVRSDRIGGQIEYDPGMITPHLRYETVGSRGKLDIAVEHGPEFDDEEAFSFPGGVSGRWKDKEGEKYRADLDIRLPPGIPLDMEFDLGLGQTDLDLSGLSVSGLRLECGLSDVTITMDTPNPVRTRTLTIKTGLGDFNARGLGNLKAKAVRVNVGLGSADLDFSGDGIEDMDGKIEVGLGSLDLVLPREANVRLEVSKSFLSSVDVNDLVQEGSHWVSDRWESGRPTLELDISVGLGSVDVEVK